MDWLTDIHEAIDYIEANLLTVESPDEVARHIHIPPMYLQNGFRVMTGFTVWEYIRNRRLYNAALELSKTDRKVIDIALDHGYETPESFTKAFTRFHGVSPSEVRHDSSLIKTFLPLRIIIHLQGGNKMDYSVENMGKFKVIGISEEFRCYGPMPDALQSVNRSIWNEWLPGNYEYELAGQFNIEWYSPVGKTSDADYQSAIWVPVVRK